MPKKKKVIVDRKFLLDLANDIYDPKTRKFLRLCDGKLQNGPDPTDPQRPMHCGLGELYYAMTGRQPTSDDVGENGVVELAIGLSTLPNTSELDERIRVETEKTVKSATEAVKKLKLPAELKESLLREVRHFTPEQDQDEYANIEDLRENFEEILREIPRLNDDGMGDTCGIGKVSDAVYRKRSQRVASTLRKAAKLLPK